MTLALGIPLLNGHSMSKGLFYIDSLSYLFILLTALITPLCLLSGWKLGPSFYSMILILETCIFCFFAAADLFTFYVFFEATLIPLFLIIGIWGSEGRIYASFTFFLYTLLGSVSLLIAFLYINASTGVTNIQTLQALTLESFSISTQKCIWICCFIAFAVKIPMVPMHTWLPAAHVQAPAAGSVILAGVLIKMGAYGFLRISIPMLPSVSMMFSGFVMCLSVLSVIYASFVAFAQDDIKKVIAYSSIAHMGIATGGIFSLNINGMSGAVFQMLSHGLISSALFLCIGFLYDKLHTRKINAIHGLAISSKTFSGAFILFSMSSIGLPGTSGFIGEFLTFLGVAKSFSLLHTLGLAVGIVLSATYMLVLCKKIIWHGSSTNFPELTYLQILLLSPLILMTILFGICPMLLINIFQSNLELLLGAISGYI